MRYLKEALEGEIVNILHTRYSEKASYLPYEVIKKSKKTSLVKYAGKEFFGSETLRLKNTRIIVDNEGHELPGLFNDRNGECPMCKKKMIFWDRYQRCFDCGLFLPFN